MNKRASCITIGFFDSVHLGHKKVLDTVEKIGKTQNLDTKVISLYKKASPVITTELEKITLFPKTLETFSTEYNTEFDFEKCLRTNNTKILVVGENFSLGSISFEKVKKICLDNAIEIVVCPLVLACNKPITTNLVQEALLNNDLNEFTRLCGYPYTIVNTIIIGKQKGRTVGMPTANIDFSPLKILPKNGVYATAFHVDNEVHTGITNIGMRPTVDSESRISVETFILEFDRMIYGKTCIVEILSFIRGVKKFNSLEEVKNQVQKDIEIVKAQ